MDFIQPVRSTPYRGSNVLRFLRREEVAYQIDHLLSTWVNPRDTLVVAGFWRSGTTWLQQSLAKLIKAKTVFEPFLYEIPTAKAISSYAENSTRSLPFQRLYLPYCGDDTLSDRPLHRHFEQALRSDLRGRLPRLLRNNVAESFRLRIVAKFVRAQLCLWAAQNTFSMPVIYIYRDPRAIMASIKMTKWDWLFGHLSLREQLIDPRDGRASYFSSWHDEIMEYDKQHKFIQITAYWALTEKFVQHCYENHQERIAFISYEELCLKREIKLLEILDMLGLDHISCMHVNALREDSFSTSEKRRGMSGDERITGWQQELSRSEITMVESVVQHFGLTDRLFEREGPHANESSLASFNGTRL